MKLALGEMSYLLFSSKNLSAQKIMDNGFQFQFSEIKQAIADLYS
jgi:NAD dependent epimerase/dehydratase family enzyme